MSNAFSFTLEAVKGQARAGYMNTPHGRVPTPIYMPVGTQASVKALDSRDIVESQAPIILANTYHLYLRPGTELLDQFGGVHNFMHWQGPMLTDSGGFQVFSLGKESGFIKIREDGVEFASYVDGSRHLFTPERAIEIQRHIGADIIMAFDECTPDQATPQYARAALDRTHRWARQCVTYWEEQGRRSHFGRYQALFGIVQGAMIPDLRRESAHAITSLPFDGIAVGGETVGYNMAGTAEVMDWIEPLLPADKPRYAMGLGLNPQDIIDAVLMGFDMFDCVAPTRIARNANLYVGSLEVDKGKPVLVSDFPQGRMSLVRSEFAKDERPIQPGCDCSTCQEGYSRAYLRHLFKAKELEYYRLASIHNVRFMIRLTEDLRRFILNG